MDFEKIKNPTNRKYVRDFIELELARRNTGTLRRKSSYSRLKSLLNDLSPDKDIKEWTISDVEILAVKIVEKYKSYWSVKSYIQILRQLIKYIHNLQDEDNLPKKYRALKTPNASQYKDRFRSEDKIITPEEAIKRVDKYAKNKKEACVFMMLIDLGLRPHELLKAKKKDIIKDDLDHYSFRVSEHTKTGKRDVILVFSIPYVVDYIRNLEEDDFIYPHSDRALWKIVNRISGGKITTYDLRASSMSYYGLYLTDQELKHRYGSEEFKHYVRLSKHKLASKLDRLTGRNTGTDDNEGDMSSISPKYCPNCKNYSNYDSVKCKICDKHFNLQTEITQKIYTEIAYLSHKELIRINPNKALDIADSIAKKHGAILKKV